MKTHTKWFMICTLSWLTLPQSTLLSQPAYLSGNWVKTGGPIGGLGYDIRYSFDNHDRWYVTDAWGGIFMSDDRGLHWISINEGITTRKGLDGIPVFCVAVDPHNSSNVWIGTEGTGKIYKSDNGGELWVEKSQGISDTLNPLSFRGITIDPHNPQIMFAMAEISSAGWHPSGESVIGIELDMTMGIVFKSTDGGENWREVWRGNNLARYCLINPKNTQEIYVSTGIFDREAANTDVQLGIAGGVGILKSEDGGESWRVLNESNGLMDLYVGSLFMHPLHPDTLLAAASQNNWSDYGQEFTGGVYLTTNGGESWQKVTQEKELFAVVEYSTSHPNMAYAITNRAAYRSEDHGFTWQRFGRQNNTWGPPGIIAGLPIDVLCDPEDPMRVMVNNYLGGNFLSLDGGESWLSASDGYTGSLVRALGISKSNPALIYSGSRSGVYYSKNGGDNWFGLANPPEGLPAKLNEISTMAVNPLNDQSLRTVAMDYPAVLYSYDGGSSWQATEKFINLNSVRFFPGDTSILYGFRMDERMITTPDDLLPETEADSLLGLYRSLDGGIHWSQLESESVKGKWLASFEVDPTNPDVIYVSRCNGTLLKSTDGGNTWNPIGGGLPAIPALSLKVSKAHPNTLYAGLGYMFPSTGDGLYKSEDGGISWNRLAAGLGANPIIRSIAIDPENDAIVYVADHVGGVFVSDDGGETWQNLSEGIDHRETNVLEISAEGTVLYLGTEGGGVYRLGDVETDPTHISINKHGDNRITIEAGFPNPFTNLTTLNLTVLNTTDIMISVYNTTGQRVRTLIEQSYTPGQYAVQWDGTNDAGAYVQNGLYILHITAGLQTKSMRIAYMK